MISELLSPYCRWCESQSTTEALGQIIANELALLNDPDYLVREVIGTGEFDWDFRCLDEGFLALVRPYLSQSSGSLPLFQSALQDLGADTSENRVACLLIEFGHFATLINDYYTFHPDLTGGAVNAKRASLLTQLRYAGQYLSMYPRYLLVNDKFSLSDPQQINLHEALAGSVVIQGASRGVALKWSNSANLPKPRDHYLQNCINTIHSYVVFPVVLACILANVDRETISEIRVAIGHLALAIKLAIERELFDGLPTNLSDAARSTASLLSSSNHPGIDYDGVIDDCLATLTRKLSHIGLLEQWGKGLALALSKRTAGSQHA